MKTQSVVTEPILGRSSGLEALRVEDLRVAYGDAVAVGGVSLHVSSGEIVALLGANGAGKSSLLGAISGLVPTASGQVFVNGLSLAGVSAERRAHTVALVPEGRRLFPQHTARENLLLAAFGASSSGRRTRLEEVERVLPRLAEFANRRAGLLSGGEQQMVALGRGLMSDARTLMIDELSLGLAPPIVSEFAETLRALRNDGYAILLVEQYLGLALSVADRAIVLDRGRVSLHGTVDEVRDSVVALEEAYLGGAAPPVLVASEDVELQTASRGSTAPESTPPTGRGNAVAAVVGALALLASSFAPWFTRTSFSGESTSFNGWEVPGMWCSLSVALAVAAALIATARARYDRPLPTLFGVAVLAASVGSIGVLFARCWLLQSGFPELLGSTYQRSWGLLLALQFAPLILLPGFKLMVESFPMRRPRSDQAPGNGDESGRG